MDNKDENCITQSHKYIFCQSSMCLRISILSSWYIPHVKLPISLIFSSHRADSNWYNCSAGQLPRLRMFPPRFKSPHYSVYCCYYYYYYFPITLILGVCRCRFGVTFQDSWESRECPLCCLRNNMLVGLHIKNKCARGEMEKPSAIHDSNILIVFQYSTLTAAVGGGRLVAA